MNTDWVQSIVATPACCSKRRCSSNASAGVFHPRVFRGRPLSMVATASISSASSTRGQCPWESIAAGVRWCFRSFRVAKDWRVGEVDGMPVSTLNCCVLRELFASVPCQGSAELFGQCCHLGGEGVLHRDCPVAGEGGSILGGVLVSIALFTRQVDQHREPGGPLDQRCRWPSAPTR